MLRSKRLFQRVGSLREEGGLSIFGSRWGKGDFKGRPGVASVRPLTFALERPSRSEYHFLHI
jgi:hypothetical protein